MGLGLEFSMGWPNKHPPFYLSSVRVSINVRLPLAVVDLLGETLEIMAHCCLNHPAVTQKASWGVSLLPRMQIDWGGDWWGGGSGLLMPASPASLPPPQGQPLCKIYVQFLLLGCPWLSWAGHFELHLGFFLGWRKVSISLRGQCDRIWGIACAFLELWASYWLPRALSQLTCSHPNRDVPWAEHIY